MTQPCDSTESLLAPESTSDEIRRLLIETEERGRILAERTALLAKEVQAAAKANELAERDLAAREMLVAECREIREAVAKLADGLELALDRQITSKEVQALADRLALLAQLIGQLVTAIALLGRDSPAANELEQLRSDIVGILAKAVRHDSDVNVTALGQIKGDLSGNLAGRNIEKKE